MTIDDFWDRESLFPLECGLWKVALEGSRQRYTHVHMDSSDWTNRIIKIKETLKVEEGMLGDKGGKSRAHV